MWGIRIWSFLVLQPNYQQAWPEDLILQKGTICLLIGWREVEDLLGGIPKDRRQDGLKPTRKSLEERKIRMGEKRDKTRVWWILKKIPSCWMWPENMLMCAVYGWRGSQRCYWILLARRMARNSRNRWKDDLLCKYFRITETRLIVLQSLIDDEDYGDDIC